jgi:hypothetical protein
MLDENVAEEYQIGAALQMGHFFVVPAYSFGMPSVDLGEMEASSLDAYWELAEAYFLLVEELGVVG